MEALKSSLWIYNDAHILEKSDITVTTARQTQVAFKKCGPFPKCIRKIDETTAYDAEDLDLVMAMYNLIEWETMNRKLLQSLMILNLSIIRLNYKET